MKFDPGFDIVPTTEPMGFRLGPDCFDNGVEVRKLDAIRKSLRRPRLAARVFHTPNLQQEKERRQT